MVQGWHHRRRGVFLPVGQDWPLPSIGLPHFSGRYLRTEEWHYLQNPSSRTDGLFAALVEAGLLLRPGFKYGCRWRAYEDDIEVAHAPWLIQPRSEAPDNWEEVCLLFDWQRVSTNDGCARSTRRRFIVSQHQTRRLMTHRPVYAPTRLPWFPGPWEPTVPSSSARPRDESVLGC